MLGRELSIVLRSQVTWLQGALAALLVGHGFVLAVDIYSAGSRSVGANLLMEREFDPLFGIVRPMLGGLYLSLSVLAPLVAARPLAVEKERGTDKALLLNTAAPLRLLCTKFIAGLAGVSLQAVPPLVFLILWRLIGGHLALVETIVSLTGYALYIVFVAAVGLAAAAWSSSVAQAATGAVLVLLASWAIDVSEGFAALAWLGRAVDWSVTTELAPMERGILSIGSVLWMASASLGALRLAWIGLRFDIPAHRRASGMLGLLLLVALVCSVARGERTRFDWTEARRNSFAPAVEQAVREIPLPLTLEVYLDRDDARRRQFESDALTKLRLARPDLEVRTPLDARPLPAEGEREEGYGKIVVRVGAASRQTYSTSRRELVTLLLEAAGRPAPDWQDPQYHGYPLVVTEARRNLVLATSYFALPLVFLLIGDLARPSGRTPR